MRPALVAVAAFTAFSSTLAQGFNSTLKQNSTDLQPHDGFRGHGFGFHHRFKGDGQDTENGVGDGSGRGDDGGDNGNDDDDTDDGNDDNTEDDDDSDEEDTEKPNQGSTLERCAIFQDFNRLLDTASNDTRLQLIFRGNDTRIARFRNDAAQLQNSSTPQGALLQRFRNNATFVSTCNAIFSIESSDQSCKHMIRLQNRVEIVNNATRLAQASRDNSTRAAQIQDQVTRDQPELDALQANATLQQFCAGFQTRSQCQAIVRLEAKVMLARNATKLNETFDGNTTRIIRFQAMATKALARLDVLLGNSTLMSLCKTEVPSIIELGMFLCDIIYPIRYSYVNNQANELPNTTVAATESSSSSYGPAGSVLPIVILVFAFCNFL